MNWERHGREVFSASFEIPPQHLYEGTEYYYERIGDSRLTLKPKTFKIWRANHYSVIFD
jgi:hypothetical protein